MELFADRYRPIELLGEGAFGRVLHAEDEHLGRPVALKILAKMTQNPQVRDRFRREARVTARLKHPHVIEVLDFGETPTGVAYISYEYVEGTDLHHRLRRRPRPDPETGARWARSIAEALAVCHEAGVLHRDLKPANILLRDGDHPLLADFGLAGDEGGESLTRTGQVMGTPMYMAPEVWRGALHDEGADQFAWGAVFQKVLYGHHPYEDPETGKVDPDLLLSGKWRPRPLPARDGVPDLMRQVIERAVRLEPADRFASMRALVDHLEQAEISLAMAEIPPPPPRPPMRSLAPALGVSVLLGLAVLGAGLSLTGRQEASVDDPGGETVAAAEDPDRREIDSRLEKLLEGHLDGDGELIDSTDPHRLELRERLLDPLFPLQLRRILEALDRWLERRRARELDERPYRTWVNDLRRAVAGHLLKDIGGLDTAIGSRMRDIGLGARGNLGQLGAQSRAALARRDECRQVIRDLLPRLESRFDDPPHSLFVFLGKLTLRGAREERMRYLQETERRLDRPVLARTHPKLIEMRADFLDDMIDQTDLYPDLRALLETAHRRFQGLRSGVAAQSRYRYVESGLRCWARMRRDALTPGPAGDLAALDRHLDEMEAMHAEMPQMVRGTLRWAESALLPAAQGGDRRLEERLGRIRRILARGS